MAFKRKKRLLDGKHQTLFLTELALPAIQGGLLCVAFIMTWKGVTDFMTARDFSTGIRLINIGSMTFRSETVTAGVTAFVILMLIIAMFVALRRMLAPIATWKRVLAAFLYALLFLFSVGFGYGFWWGLFASKNVSEGEARAASNELHIQAAEISARLESAERDIKSVAAQSRQSADSEMKYGGTCGDQSRPHEGPRTIYRRKLATDLEQVAADASTEIGAVTKKLNAIDVPLKSYLARTGETGREELAHLDFELQQSAAILNQDLKHVRDTLVRQMTAKRNELIRKPSDPNFVCYDEELAQDLGAAIDGAQKPIELKVRRLTYMENAEGTAVAVERLWQSVGDLLQKAWHAASFHNPGPVDFSIPLFREDAGGGRNIAAFIAAAGVDFALLIFVLIGSKAPFDTFDKLVPASASNLDKLVFLLETFIEKGDEEAIRFWRRCMLRVKGKAFFLAPNPDLAPENKRPYLEAVEVLASVLSEVNGMGIASRMRFREAWSRGVQRLAAWGWDKPTARHFDLYVLKSGEFREIATRLEKHKLNDEVEAQPAMHIGPPIGPHDSEVDSTSVKEPNSVPWDQAFQWLLRMLRSALKYLRDAVARSGPSEPAPMRVQANQPVGSAPPKNSLLDILAQVRSDAPSQIEADSRTDELDGARVAGSETNRPAIELPAAVSEELEFEKERKVGSGAVDTNSQIEVESAQNNLKPTAIDIKDVIENLHDLELAVKVMDNASVPGYSDGLTALRKKWESSLHKYGIEAFGQIGEKPDPNTHFIIGSKPSALPAGVVAEVLRSGYRKDGRVLHEADVFVSEGTADSSSASSN